MKHTYTWIQIKKMVLVGKSFTFSWKRQWKCYNTVSTKAFSFIVVYDQISNLLNNVTQWKSNQEEE